VICTRIIETLRRPLPDWFRPMSDLFEPLEWWRVLRYTNRPEIKVDAQHDMPLHVVAVLPDEQERYTCPKLLDEQGRYVRSDCRMHGPAAIAALHPDDRAEACCHLRMARFDPIAAQGMQAYEVRKRWPRGSGVCPDCGCSGIFYASAAHYIAGDW
jgi:hypothetical protein